MKTAELWNAYGPTETTIQATIATDLSAEGAVTIGRPIGNTQAYVLDEDMEPAPVGVAGELYVGGAGLARGYLNRSEPTATQFVPNPFSRRAGDRLYRTGDRVQWRENGALEYLGRIDDQVKLRGYRIEPSEIEATLIAHEAVKQAVVVVREDHPGQKQLVGYVVRKADSDGAGGSEWRRHLRERLPDYMVPAAFVEMAELPLLPSGKIDRRRLPPPEFAGSDESYAEPRNATESALCRIWAEVLGLERVGIHDNFFELGGHSILAVQIMARVRDFLGVDVSVAAIFLQNTVADFAPVVEEKRGREKEALRLQIAPLDRKSSEYKRR